MKQVAFKEFNGNDPVKIEGGLGNSPAVPRAFGSSGAFCYFFSQKK